MQTLEQLMAAQRAKELRARYAKIMAAPATLSAEDAEQAATDAAQLYGNQLGNRLASITGNAKHSDTYGRVGGGLAMLASLMSRPDAVDKLTRPALQRR